MTENKDNPPINLELLERQLREALARRPSDIGQEQQAGSRSDDPLAELSRLTGYDNAPRSAQPAAVHTLTLMPDVVQPSAETYAPQSVSDPYAALSKFSQPQHTEEPPNQAQSASAVSNLRANIPLFQSIAVNYGGFQNPAVAQPATDPLHQQAHVPPRQQSVLQSHDHVSAHMEGGSVTGIGSALDQSQNKPYGDITVPSEHHEPPAPTPPHHDFTANPYERLEQPAPQPITVPPKHDPIFESRIFSNHRTSVAEPQSVPRHVANGTHHDAMWPPQQEPRAGLSMSEAEAHDDLLHLAQKENKVGSSGKGAYILLGLLALLGVGFSLAAYLRNEGTVIPAGPAPVITADKAPVKVAPVDQGESQSQSQAAAIYQPGKMDDPKDAKIVNNEEKPVDVNTVQRPAGAPLLGEPKKIRTVTIRPDGTIVEDNSTIAGGYAPNVAATPRPGATLAPLPYSSSQAVPPVAVATPSVPNVSAPVVQPVVPAAPHGPIVRVLPPERPQTIASAPTQAAPVEKPAAPSTASVEKIEAGSGDYGVQFGAPASETEARTMIANLKKANAKVFDGLSFVVQKADNNGRTIFRVRVIGLAREGAISLCEKMKSSGTQCFVAKN